MPGVSTFLLAMLALVVLALLLQRLFVWRRFRRRAAREVVPALPRALRRCAAKPAWVVAHLIRLKALMPDAGCRRIAQTFNRRFALRSVSVSKSYVADVLRRHAYEVAFVRRQIKHRVPRPIRTNLVWGVDLTGKRDMNGDVHSILGIVDHGSRRLLSLCLCPRANALTLLGHLFLTMGRHGIPGALRTDNASVFTSWWFAWGLALLGVSHQLTTPGCPWQNGRIERVFGTLKQELDRLRVASGGALAQLLGEFALWYNEVRPHQHLDGATPMEVWRGINPLQERPKEIRWLSFWNGQLAGYWLRR